MSDKQDNVGALVQVRVLYFEGCPNHAPTVRRIRAVAERLNVSIELNQIEVTPDDDPHRLGFRGSPTVQINGIDLDPAARGRDNCGFGCRMYGGAGVPDEAMMEAALTDPPGSDDHNEQAATLGDKSPAQRDSSEGCSACGSPARDVSPTSARSSVSSSVAAFGTTFVASACCWLPLLLVGLGLSLSLGGLIDALHTVRPYLLIVAGLCLAAGFYMVYFEGAPRRRTPQVALWTALVATLAMALFPYYSGALFGASNTGGSSSTAAPHIVPANGAGSEFTTLTYEIEGMTCGGCAAAVCSAMSGVSGVEQCRASYEKGRAWATVAEAKLEHGSLVHAVERVGFAAERITE